MLSTDSFPQGFVVAIRWRGPDPNFQLQTKHAGFKTASDAARFAGDNTPTSVRSLFFSPQGVWILRGQNDFLSVPGDRLTGWSRLDDEGKFERKLFPEIAQRESAFGEYQRCGYVVLGPDGIPARVALGQEEDDMLPAPVLRSIN